MTRTQTTEPPTELRPGRSYCSSVTSNDCQAPAGFSTGNRTGGVPGVRRADLLTCGYCCEPVCAACSTLLTPPAFFRNQTPVPVCGIHSENELAQWLGVS